MGFAHSFFLALALRLVKTRIDRLPAHPVAHLALRVRLWVDGPGHASVLALAR
jgi:hypothetical protein